MDGGEYAHFVQVWQTVQNREPGKYKILLEGEKRDRLIAALKHYMDVYQPCWKHVSFSDDHTAILIGHPIEDDLRR